MKSDHRNVPDTMLSERPSGRNLLEGQEEAVGKAILDSGLIDEQRLFHALGLYLSERDEFVELYARIPTPDRPALTPFFDPRFYLESNPDVEAASLDPFYHFVRWGLMERRAPHPLVSLIWMFDGLSDAAVAEGAGLLFADMLIKNVRSPHPYFDLLHYLETYPDARSFPGGAFRHYLEAGNAISAAPNAYFDPAWYRDRYSDVAGGAVDAFIHFVVRGDGEHRFPSASFDPDWYVHAYPDVKASAYPPLHHFLWHGRTEGRKPANSRRPTAGNSGYDAGVRGSGFRPASLEDAEARYLQLKTRAARQRRARIEAFAETDIRPCVIEDIDSGFTGLAFPKTRQPMVSILIPCFDQLSFTLECLHSILKAAPAIPYEVIVADDASLDPLVRRLRRVPGLRYYRNPRNVGFLRSCNAAFKRVRGQYVLLLNNDAQVLSGTIEALTAILHAEPDVAAAGPQILYPNGRLQEAGCAMNADGTSTMVGLFEDPELPAYNRRRDVHGCSAAGLLVRCAYVRGPLFDDRFAPAYCEDMDLCLRLITDGYRVVYEPKAKLVHHLSVSMTAVSQQSKLRRVVRNQQRLLEKWQDQLEQLGRVRALAFYLPQFHAVQENDLWWGAGFTEWTNVTGAEPSYAGHYQPHLPSDLGFYDLRVPETLAKQAQLADRYGIEGFCVYYYNFNGKRMLEKPLEILIKNTEIPFRFCICWANENWSRRWDGGDQEVLLAQFYSQEALQSIVDDLTRYARDARYLRVNGRPIFMVYRPLLIPNAADAMNFVRRAAREAGIGELHLICVESMEAVDQALRPSDLGFDAAVEFPPQGVGVPASDERQIMKSGWHGFRYDYEATLLNATERGRPDFKRYPAAFPMWDNTPRQPLYGTSFDNATPEKFQYYLEQKIEEARSFFVGDERLVFINAWNEWAEGAHLEPDQVYGHTWLEAVKRALSSS